MKDSVSVIMPIYNVESYIEATLCSVFNQTYKNIEYILVDDRGTDNSMKKIYEMLESDIYKDKNFKVIKHECNKGVSAARNTGVANSSSEYIYFMDSDDIITPNCIELHVNAMKKNKLDFTVGGIETIGSKTVHIRRLDNKVVDGRVVDAYLKRGWDPGPCNKLINKEFLLKNKIQFTEGIRFEDILWAYYMSKNANRVELIAEQTYKYMIHKGSFVTSKNTVAKVQDLITVINTINSDEIDEQVLPIRNKYISFLKLNAALLLLNFNGTNNQKKELYKQIKQIKSFGMNIYNMILMLPYWLFNILFSPLYKGYKKMQA